MQTIYGAKIAVQPLQFGGTTTVDVPEGIGTRTLCVTPLLPTVKELAVTEGPHPEGVGVGEALEKDDEDDELGVGVGVDDTTLEDDEQEVVVTIEEAVLVLDDVALVEDDLRDFDECFGRLL